MLFKWISIKLWRKNKNTVKFVQKYKKDTRMTFQSSGIFYNNFEHVSHFDSMFLYQLCADKWLLDINSIPILYGRMKAKIAFFLTIWNIWGKIKFTLKLENLYKSPMIHICFSIIQLYSSRVIHPFPKP